MASNVDPKRTAESWTNNPPMHASFEDWLARHGKTAYKDFKNDHPTSKLSYEDWRQTDQVYGGYLFYAALLVWNEDGSSEDERVKRRRVVRVPDRDPKKTVTTNGNGALRTAGSATPTPVGNSDELNASGKRKRKPRKKYTSQELVASDEEPANEVEAATPNAGITTPAASAIIVNGGRKSISRKPRKKPLSDETISPEDENDDPMEIDTPIVASPLPVRSAPRAAAAANQSESPKKTTPKRSSVKKSRKSFLVRLPFHLWDAVNLDEKSEEMVLDEETDHGDASVAEVSRPATTLTTKHETTVNNKNTTDTNIDGAVESEAVEDTPDPSAANTRRGLRNRKPAQKRPYYHDAQLFEDAETETEDEDSPESSPEPPRQPSSPGPDILYSLWDALTTEAVELWKEKIPEEHHRQIDPEKPRQLDDDTPKTKHFKGKGRAWKKEGSDEDEEFTPKQKKAAKAARAKADKAKPKADKVAEKAATDDTPRQKKKIGRPRKSNLSEDIVRDDSDNDTSMLGAEASPQATPIQPPKRGRGRPRKSALSSEIVRDDSEDEAPTQSQAPKQAELQPTANLTTPPKTKSTSRPSTATSSAPASNSTHTPKKRGRPRKSPANTTPLKSATQVNTNEAEAHAQLSSRRNSTATATSTPAEPNLFHAQPNTSAIPEYPTPTINHGAALVESLYPRDPSRQSSQVPEPAAAEIEDVGGSFDSKAVEQNNAAAAAAAAETKNEAENQQAENKMQPANNKETTNPVPVEAAAKPDAGAEPHGEEDRDREMSASMSLSSDSEL